MIRSRVFLAFSFIVALISLVFFLFVDLRDPEDRAYVYFQESNYEKVLNLSKDIKKNPSELGYSLLSMAVSSLEKKANDSKFGEQTLKFLKEKHPEIKIAEWETTLGTYYHLEDPYLVLLKKHSIHYKKALIAKISSFQKPIPKDKVSHFLIQLSLEDPRGLETSYSQALANLLRFPLEPIGELESSFLFQTLNYLSNTSLSLFYENHFSVTGSNVNLRSGPGKENKEVGKVSAPDITFCFEKDSHEETVSGKAGNFIQCFYPHLLKSAWIFSGFLQKSSPNEAVLKDFEERFKSNESIQRIDFVSWLGPNIPPGYYGTYIPRDRFEDSGEIGFPLFKNKAKNYRKICKKFSGEKSYFEFSYLPTDSKEPVPFLEILLVYEGKGHVVYSFESDKESIWINRNRYILDQGDKRQNLSLNIISHDKERFVASLKDTNIILQQNLKSEPIEMNEYLIGKTHWEFCLPLAMEPSKEKVLLFEINSGKN